MVSKEVKTEVRKRLAAIEQERDVTVLYAVESGSRAWGFESPNSDYDVRFVYAHKRDWYLTVRDKRDVIEKPIVDDYDLSGWDVRKALQLLRKSNPSLVEWLHSPVVYRCDDKLAPAMRALVAASYSSMRGIHHYRSMAHTNYRGYLREAMVPLKKYFYVLRPLLAARWVERFKTAPPLEFERLLAMLDSDTKTLANVHELLEQKRNALEKQVIPNQPVLTAFIETELERLKHVRFEASPAFDSDALDDLFRTSLA